MRKKKVLLILAGQLRTFDNQYVVNGWNKFFDKYDVTTFICCWDNRGRSIFSKKVNLDDGISEEEQIPVNIVQEIFKTKNVRCFNYEKWLNGPEFKEWMRQYQGDKFFNCIFAAYYLRNKAFEFAKETVDIHSFEGAYLTRPDSFFIKELPEYPFLETECLWQENSSQNFHPRRVYDNFLFSGPTVIEKICKMYTSDNLPNAINESFGSNLYFLDSCKVVYSYSILEGIETKSYDYLYSEPFRNDDDIAIHRHRYNNGNKLWCEI